MATRNNNARLVGLAIAGLLHASVAAADYYTDARQLSDKGDLKGAVIQLKNALQENPEDARARLLLGQLYLKAGDGASAEKELRRAQQLGVKPEQLGSSLYEALLQQRKYQDILDRSANAEATADVLAYRGLAHAGLGDGEQAKKDFDAALAADPNHLKATVGQAAYLAGQKQFQPAIELLNKYIAANPDSYEALLARAEVNRISGQIDAALADFESVLDSRADDPKALIGSAYMLLAKREFDTAEKRIKQLPEQANQLPAVQYLLAAVRFQQKQFPQALEHVQAVLRLIPDHLQSQMLHGVISYAQQDYQLAESFLSRVHKRLPAAAAGNITKLLAATYLKLSEAGKAVELLEAALQSSPDDSQLMSLLGTAYLQTGDNAKAQQWLSAAAEKAPDQAGVRTQLALGMLAAGETGEAISQLQTAVDLGQDLIQADVLLVMSHLRQGNFDAALKASTALEKRHPDSPIPVNLTGLAYLSQKRYDEAKKAFEQALKIDPKFSTARANIGRMQVLKGDIEAATATFKQILDSNPSDTTALFALAQLARQAGKLDESEQWLKQAQEKNPDNVKATLALAEHYLLVSDGLKALTALSAVPDAAAESPAVLRLRGMAQMQAKQTASAVRTLQQLVQKAPKLIEAHFQLARAYIAAGEQDKAVAQLQTATGLDTGYRQPIVWLALAEAQVRNKNFAAALRVTEQLLAKYPKLAAVHEMRAAAHQGAGDMASAIKSYEQAVALEPNSQRVRVMAQAYASSGQTDKGIALLENWLKRTPNDAASAMTLGMAYQQQGKNADAARAYELSLKAQPNNPVVMNNLAWIYLQQGDSRAVELGRKAYEAAPKQPEIVDTYGWILLETGDAAKALPVLQQALLQNPAHPEIGYHVAVALQRLNRGEEARPILNRIMRNNPGSAFAKQAKQLLDQI